MTIQKYAIHNEAIPQSRRKEMNGQIIRMIDSKENSISPEQVFNTYTGNGGLHGLSFGDSANFHQYTSGKKTIDNGQFFTPHSICKFMVSCIKPSEKDLIVDLTCGMDNFFNYLPNENTVFDVERVSE